MHVVVQILSNTITHDQTWPSIKPGAWNIPELSGTSRNNPEHPGTSRNIPEHPGTSLKNIYNNYDKKYEFIFKGPPARPTLQGSSYAPSDTTTGS